MSGLPQEVEKKSKSSFLTRLFLRSHRARRATASAASGVGKTSGVIHGDSTAASAGASKNSAELSRHLDDILLEVGQDGSLNIEQEHLAEHLWEASEGYTNCILPEGLPECNCSVDEIKLIKLAALASSTVYHKPNNYAEIKEGTNEANIFDSTRYIPASNSGNIKAVSLSHVAADSTHKQSTLFIAIRGSASLMDWLINADGDVIDVDEIFLPRSTDETESYRSHRGLLHVAMRMGSSLQKEIENFLDDQEGKPSTGEPMKPDLVLTGHSAGGGIAALVFARLLLYNDKTYKRTRYIHLVTFGAPPIFSSALNTKLIKLHQNMANVPENGKGDDSGTQRGLFMSIVNQGDPVARADKAYIRSLVELYAKNGPTESINASPQTSKKEWALPPAELVNAGVVVVAHDTKADIKETDWKLSIVDQRILDGLVWGNVKAHAIEVYGTAIGMF